MKLKNNILIISITGGLFVILLASVFAYQWPELLKKYPIDDKQKTNGSTINIAKDSKGNVYLIEPNGYWHTNDYSFKSSERDLKIVDGPRPFIQGTILNLARVTVTKTNKIVINLWFEGKTQPILFTKSGQTLQDHTVDTTGVLIYDIQNDYFQWAYDHNLLAEKFSNVGTFSPDENAFTINMRAYESEAVPMTYVYNITANTMTNLGRIAPSFRWVNDTQYKYKKLISKECEDPNDYFSCFVDPDELDWEIGSIYSS